MTSYRLQKPQQPVPAMPHRLTLDERRALTLTGVNEVLRFDEQSVVLKTVKGILIVRGSGLQLQTLVPEGGRVSVEGSVDSMSYEALREGGFFRRLFG